MSDLIAVKRAMRAGALLSREAAHQALAAMAPAAVRDHFITTFKPARDRKSVV